MTSVYQSVAAWRHALEAMLALGRPLSDPEWAAPTECPKWTVKDIYAHVIGGERWMAAGHRKPDQGIDQLASEPVLARRDTSPAALLDELRDVYEQRLLQLERADIDPQQPTWLPIGTTGPLELLLRTRVLDVWTHEQDIRRAVGRPGNLASPGAAIVGELITSALPRIVARAGQAPPDSLVRLTTRGEVNLDLAVAVDQAGRGTLTAPRQSATCHLTLSWEGYTRLSAGRGSRGDFDIRITGDRALGERILSNLTVTP